MPKTYTRLSVDERYQIYEGVTEKRSHREIAILLNKHYSTVSNELKRNKGLRVYRPKQASPTWTAMITNRVITLSVPVKLDGIIYVAKINKWALGDK